MITVLRIIKKDELGLKDRLLSAFTPCTVTTETKRKNDITVFEVTYRQLRGRIRYDKIYQYCRGKSKVLLCDRELNLFNTPFHRFGSLSLRRALMKNLVIDILKKSDIPPSQLRLSFYDPNAEYPSFAENLLEYSSFITVVTDMPKFYENEAQRISGEKGAEIIVSNNISDLYPSDMIISPAVIRKPISAAVSTLIFTPVHPTVTVTGSLICEYNMTLPEKYRDIIPEGVDEMYFMSALYVLCRQTELAKAVPSSCGDMGVLYEEESIIRRLRAKTQIEVV